jgi:hypothetical protein
LHDDDFPSSPAGARYGSAVAIGRFGDGALGISAANDAYADLAVGAPYRDAWATDSGKLRVDDPLLQLTAAFSF